MEKFITELSEIKLVGITVRTNTANEMNLALAKIGPIIQTYFANGLSEKITHRKKPGVTYCIYSDYESDMTGDYTYFVGEEVENFSDQPEEFHQLTIPKQSYAKFTAGPGAMPDVCITAWQKIWQMPAKELGGTRKYVADFELYDERATDPQQATLDIFIGIEA